MYSIGLQRTFKTNWSTKVNLKKKKLGDKATLIYNGILHAFINISQVAICEQ